jgi:hypothetical protein
LFPCSRNDALPNFTDFESVQITNNTAEIFGSGESDIKPSAISHESDCVPAILLAELTLLVGSH